MSKVLVVDDSPTELSQFKEMLEGLGHEVITAENGESSTISIRRSCSGSPNGAVFRTPMRRTLCVGCRRWYCGLSVRIALRFSSLPAIIDEWVGEFLMAIRAGRRVVGRFESDIIGGGGRWFRRECS